MKNHDTTTGHRARSKRRPKAGRQWMPVTDPWIGSDDSRLWCRSEEIRSEWSQEESWMRRIQFS